MKKKCIIVIPVYKDAPNNTERASFFQALNILKNHDICIITHNSCNLTVYKKISEKADKSYSIELFDINYFKSIDGYNDLCYSKDFYLRFNLYEYMLIYQLDAWVFRDELEYWCNRNYDYIGAPLFYAYNKFTYTEKYMGVGNGGFCLRKISHCLRILSSNPNKPYINLRGLLKMYSNYLSYNEKYPSSIINRLCIIPIILFKLIGIKNNLKYYIINHVNEDMIFGTWSSKEWGNNNGNIPSKEEAMKFSFEVHPSLLYKKNNYKLPFGCHAFEKWEYNEFWSNFIKIYNS